MSQLLDVMHQTEELPLPVYLLLPAQRVTMYWDVKTVKPLTDFRIYVEVEDGRKGVSDLKPYLDHGVFREFQDASYFKQVGVLFGAVTWPHEQDIAPETLLAEMTPVESDPSLDSCAETTH